MGIILCSCTSLMQAAQFIQVVEEWPGAQDRLPRRSRHRESYITGAQLKTLAAPS